MRLIDADAFDKYLLGAEIEATKSRKYVFRSAINTIRGNLANFPTVNQWIPCSERYPEQDERVIVTVGGYDCSVWDCMSNRGDDYFWEDEQGLYHNKYEVLAWMPLPEPYKEGNG